MSTRLDRAVWPEVPAAGALVLVPVGSTEQHGPHLPLTTDTVIARAVADRVAARLPGQALVAPAIGFGNSGEHAGFPGTISIGHEALRLVLVETMRSLALWAGRVVFVNGHGGNTRTLDEAVAMLRAEGHHAAWTACVLPGDAHAGRSETSVMLHLAPDEVRLAEAAAGDTRPLAALMPKLVRSGVRSVAPNGVLGDPAGAGEQEGRALLDALVDDTVRRVTAFTADHRGRLV
ncbi:mycofactocin biosynthesis peptidyl-dipeptidase MftE [Catellatospora bangladeshensis]|uniref:Putative mycofactocin system creatinine amidohydrolase family protein MftE n=1 Tax=Catellatospora bangladeshensis TaxID=310355 RepID=A0A8J3NLX0_9ACTN|nr:mycofactocin biosynthesis peptidyl-dipeptidase MftE [Catellatospora bangladeshensis]GIF85615.1 putative mycofactocin system creatinine amidohydrolase family protein MftE [Catellatospora bangladeshensis]